MPSAERPPMLRDAWQIRTRILHTYVAPCFPICNGCASFSDANGRNRDRICETRASDYYMVRACAVVQQFPDDAFLSGEFLGDQLARELHGNTGLMTCRLCAPEARIARAR